MEPYNRSSILEKELDKFSDIDIMFVIKDEYFIESSRGHIKYNNIIVEYFAETDTEIYKDFIIA